MFRWLSLIVVLKCDNTVLYDRLNARNYSHEKIEENLEVEIMQTIQEEAFDAFEESRIWVLKSNSEEDFEHNLDVVSHFVRTVRQP
jgi:adenylate kinase